MVFGETQPSANKKRNKEHAATLKNQPKGDTKTTFWVGLWPATSVDPPLKLKLWACLKIEIAHPRKMVGLHLVVLETNHSKGTSNKNDHVATGRWPRPKLTQTCAENSQISHNDH